MHRCSRLRGSSGPLLGALVGLLVAFVGFGPGYLFGTSAFWTYPPTDFSSHLIGWREYLQEPWTYPLLLSRKLEEPAGLNILYMDSLPLVALVAKALRGVVPDSMRTQLLNPFGWWQLVSFALQGAFAAAIARTLRASLAAQISCAVVALSMQVFITRFHHTGLSSHFLILAALWLYVRASEPAPNLRALVGASARWTCLLACTALIHPYLFVMVGGVFAATVLRWIAERRAQLATFASVSSIATVVAVMAVCGFFGARLARASDWGFGYKSTDVLSFFVPQHSPFFPWRTPMSLNLHLDEGSEGYDYLGVGVLGLAVTLAITARSAILETLRRHKALACILVAMALFAISNRVSAGGHVILELPVPKAVSWFIGQLRASGRFIWPPTYAAALYLVVLAYRRFDTGRLALLPPALVVLQLVDGMGNFAFVRKLTAHPERSWLDWSAFTPVVSAHPGVTLRPSYPCVERGHDYTVMMQMELQTMAAAHGASASGIRSSRFIVDCVKEREATLFKRDVDPRQLYAFFTPEIPIPASVHFERQGLKCFSFGVAPTNGVLCGSRIEGHALPPTFAPFPSSDYEIGTPMKIGTLEAGRYLGHGWSFGETTHRWTVGPRSSLYLRTNAPIPPGSLLRIHAGATAFPSRPRITVTLTIDETTAPPVVFTSAEAREIDVPMPPESIGQQLVEVHVATDDYRSPKQLGMNADERQLGVYILDVSILPAP